MKKVKTELFVGIDLGGKEKKTTVIAIDAPLTRGKGKGETRLYEKFLSTLFFKLKSYLHYAPYLKFAKI